MRFRHLALPFTLWACGGHAPAASQAPPPVAPSLPAPSERAMDAHLRYLASDLLEGRGPATRGGRLAAAYVAAQFEALGLAPAGADGSYFQPVALVGMALQQSTFVWGTPGAVKQLRPGDDYVAWGQRPDAHQTVDGDVVFVGYGIRASEWRWDDYKGVDLHGKILLMLVNDPGLQDSTIFRGRALTYYGRWTYKLEEAARQGAVGAVLIHTPESATYGWPVVRGSWSVEQFQLADAAGPRLAFAAWVTHDAARAALGQSGYDLDSLTRAAARSDFTPLTTRLHLAVDLSSVVRRVTSENVVGMLRGSDPALASQVVVFTAHWDHKGIGPAVNGDSIYNGAEDNASGVAAMLAAAEVLRRVQPGPRRSVLFISTTGEESGLLGSAAYVASPLMPLAHTAAVLNIDEANVRGATRDIAALGGDHSTLGAAFAAAAGAESLSTVDHPDVAGAFFRSDHFPFARVGVPALSILPGLDFVGRPAGWGQTQAEEFNSHRYHQPSDEYSPTFRYDGMAQQVRVMVRLALGLANAADLPHWLPGSEFQRPASSR